MMVKKKRNFFIFVIACASLYLFFSTGKSIFLRQSLKGKMAPDFELTSVYGGDNLDFHTQRDGEKAVIMFFATWCPECKMALKNASRDAAWIESMDIEFYIVDVGESSSKVLSFFEANGIILDVYLDGNSKIAQKYHVVGIPTYVFINEEGIITETTHALPNENKIERFFE